MAEKRRTQAWDAEGLVHGRWWKLALAWAALVGAGFTPAPGMEGSALVLVPYAATIMCTGLATRRFARLTSPLDPRKKRDLTDHVRSLGHRLAASLLAALATMLGEAAHVITTGSLDATSTLPLALFLALMALATFLLASLRRDVETLLVG